MDVVSSFLLHQGLLLDVRSPSEYDHAHIPGAVSLPLFNDLERALIGTLYKQKGKEAAVEKGLQLVGPKLFELATTAKEWAQGKPAKVYCWRGGMRSSSVAWLLKTTGLQTQTLAGGYKAFRKWTFSILAIPRKIYLLGGFTGSGKTDLLQALNQSGQQVLDLEALANHRGSSYGMLGQSFQPSNEQFENSIALVLHSLNPDQPLWIEDESRLLGQCKIPDALFHQMQRSPLFIMERPLEERIHRLRSEYATYPVDQLIEATKRVEKRLGSQKTKEAIQQMRQGNFDEAIALVLSYYDRSYSEGLNRRKELVRSFYEEGLSNDEWVQKLLKEDEK